MLSRLMTMIAAEKSRARNADELRRFAKTELRDLGVFGEDVERFLGR